MLFSKPANKDVCLSSEWNHLVLTLPERNSNGVQHEEAEKTDFVRPFAQNQYFFFFFLYESYNTLILFSGDGAKAR